MEDNENIFRLEPVMIRKVDNCGLRYEVDINGHKARHIRNIKFEAGFDQPPVLTIEMLADLNLAEDAAQVLTEYPEDDIRAAAQVMSATIRSNETVREGFIACVSSVIKEELSLDPSIDLHSVAEKIVRRIAG